MNRFIPKQEQALLALADGSIFSGISIGVAGIVTGEVVFNTSITGYQEVLTDPSYAKQMVTLTYPHIGNVGINLEDMESQRIWLSGLIIRELSPLVSNWRATLSLADFLKQHHTIAIAHVDTRRLTRLLRDQGAQSGCIMAGRVDADEAIALARQFGGLTGMDLAQTVTATAPFHYALPANEAVWLTPGEVINTQRKIVVYDFGVKTQTLRLLADRGAEVMVVPATTPASTVLAYHPDGIVLSNGPGDPAACTYAIEATKIFLEKEIPLFGICLGCQILALASGGHTEKMKFGHHGANHPVQSLEDHRVSITSQNHGFAIAETLPATLEVTHRSLFDGTIQGIRHTKKPAFGFQGHPEASPGPHDLENLFDTFLFEC